MIDTLAERLAGGQKTTSDFDLNPEVKLGEGRVLRDAAVLAAIVERSSGFNVVLTKRSQALKHHPGQIALPGGKKDDSDPDLSVTALREAEEEIGLRRETVRLLGTLPSHETVTGFNVTPFVGLIEAPFSARAEMGEVDEVFEVPLSHVLTPERFSVQSRRWRGHRRHYFTVPFGPYYIWGATARILRSWAELMT